MILKVKERICGFLIVTACVLGVS